MQTTPSLSPSPINERGEQKALAPSKHALLPLLFCLRVKMFSFSPLPLAGEGLGERESSA